MQNDEVQSGHSVVDPENNCFNCGQSLTVNPYKTQLCTPCREKYIRFPIPVWIKIFGAGILLVVLYNLISFPKHVETGIHYKRAKVAAGNHQFITAQKELAFVIAREPNYLEAYCRLLIAAVHNFDLQTVADVYKKISDKKIDDNALFSEVQQALDQAAHYFPSDSLNTFVERQNISLDSIETPILISYLNNNPDDFIVRTKLASRMFDEKKYAATDSMLNVILNEAPDYAPAKMLKPSLKREMLQFDSSYYYADQLIAANKEDMFGFASKVRTLLKQKRDDEALALAKSCYQQDPHSGYILASLAMVYHFKGDEKNCTNVMLEAGKDSTMDEQMSYAKKVISGEEFFRN